MVNSCSGKMGHATAEAVVRAGLTLVPYSITGESGAVAVSNVGVSGIPVELVPMEARQQRVRELREQYPGLVVIDYTLPSAVNDNARFYCDNQLPFVMGTTGGDREQLMRDVAESGTYAVIAPNMGKQVVAFQAMIELLSDNFPGAFAGYSLDVVESHQSSKADTSGTAKAVVESMQRLGLDCQESQIRKVRDKSGQMTMGVPESYLTGHAFHTYTLTSPGKDVTFQFQHNVCGRTIYAEGTVDACLFLSQQMKSGSEQKVFNMIDVLKAGVMR